MARELTIRLQTDQGIPLYRQIYNYVRDEIRSGSLEAGERLPSTRALASGLRVARSTADLAYSQLLSEGYIRVKKKRKTELRKRERMGRRSIFPSATQRCRSFPTAPGKRS